MTDIEYSCLEGGYVIESHICEFEVNEYAEKKYRERKENYGERAVGNTAYHLGNGIRNGYLGKI